MNRSNGLNDRSRTDDEKFESMGISSSNIHRNNLALALTDGVKWARLADVAVIKNGSSYRKFGKGQIPVYGSGGVMTYIDTYAYDKPTVLIPRKGSLDKLYYVVEPFWNVDTIFYTEIDDEVIVPKFLFYFLETQRLQNLNIAGGVPSLTQAILNLVKIPLPPLPVQQEIVRILDNFSLLTAELTAELTARQSQYEYYRDELLTNVRPDRHVAIGHICNVSRGRVLSKNYLRENVGIYPVYSSQTANNGIFGHIDSYDYDDESITWTTDGANAGSVFYHIDEKFSITNVCGLLRIIDKTEVNTKYIYYVLQMIAKKYVSSGMGNPKLMSNAMAQIPIPLPPLAEQARIVSILDKFDALVNDLSSGIPAEIEARQKQYEYYRDRLLTFKEKVS